MSALLELRELTVTVPSAEGPGITLVDGVSFAVERGERFALVGESGSGKSVTARAVMGLDASLRAEGSVRFDGTELLGRSERQLASVRGSRIGMVFQDPLSALNPLMTIGEHVMEPLRARGVSRAEAARRGLAVLDELGVADAKRRMRAYPHEFSGGMRQRVVLAMALVNSPELLIADEPTTALDVRVQAQVLEMLSEVAAARGLAVLFITHDVGVVSGFADRVAVMYSGRTVEQTDVTTFFTDPAHPYTRRLLAAVPRLEGGQERLAALPGAPVAPDARPSGCAFAPRCDFAVERCHRERPELHFTPAPHRLAACHLAPEEGSVAC